MVGAVREKKTGRGRNSEGMIKAILTVSDKGDAKSWEKSHTAVWTSGTACTGESGPSVWLEQLPERREGNDGERQVGGFLAFVEF